MAVVLVILVVGVVAWTATVVFERRSRKRARALAARGMVDMPRTDGIDGPIAAEGLLRGGLPPQDGAPFS
jgi:hypothetical protein